MKKAIVTGAAGFIGATVVEQFTNLGVDVLALGRKPFHEITEVRRYKLRNARYLQLDMRDIDRLPELSSSWDVGDECVFLNFAWKGVTRLSDLNVAAQMNNVAYAVDALAAAQTMGCRAFLQIGTMEEAFTHRYLRLDHHTNSEYNRHVIYSVAKIAAKNALKLKASQLGIDLIYVLHSHVMAPDDDKDSFLQVTLTKLIRGEELIFSTGEQLFDVISAKDCAAGYFLIGQKGIAGKHYWVGSGQPKHLREYIERMYALYPSGQEMQFGKLPYNDVKLREEDFSIAELVEDTGYSPQVSYEDIVRELHASLVNREGNGAH